MKPFLLFLVRMVRAAHTNHTKYRQFYFFRLQILLHFLPLVWILRSCDAVMWLHMKVNHCDALRFVIAFETLIRNTCLCLAHEFYTSCCVNTDSLLLWCQSQRCLCPSGWRFFNDRRLAQDHIIWSLSLFVSMTHCPIFRATFSPPNISAERHRQSDETLTPARSLWSDKWEMWRPNMNALRRKHFTFWIPGAVTQEGDVLSLGGTEAAWHAQTLTWAVFMRVYMWVHNYKYICDS